MENAAQALKIAGAVLIAIILLALLLMMFSKLSSIPQEQEYLKKVEQINEFNMEYIAYDKKLMYGVDVVSCLNKVLDNNEKSERFAGGNYDIKINITIKNTIKDTVTIYNINNKGKEVIKHIDAKISKTYKDLFPNAKELSELSKLSFNSPIEAGDYESKLTSGSYNNIDNIDDLKLLSKSTVNMKLVANNPKKEDYSNWTKVEWNTMAYDFKSRRFKCTGVEYGSEGRIISISFEEINNK